MSEPPPEARGFHARAGALTARGQAILERLEGERPRHASVEVAFRFIVRDRQIAGGVLGGGLAYRLFFWTLSLSLVAAAGFGFAAKAGDNVDGALKAAGLSTAVASSVSAAAQQAEASRWWLLLVGLYLTVWFSWSLLRALRLVHGAAWQCDLPPLRNGLVAVGCVFAMPLFLALMVTAAGWVRAHTSGAPGLVATFAAGLAFGFLWLLASMWLPHAPSAPWTAFVPGAIVFGVGLELLHVFTVYFLANKLASASALYGTLGLAGTMLFYLYLIGRGIIGAAELNAVVWQVRQERGL
jgi:membrane protein